MSEYVSSETDRRVEGVEGYNLPDFNLHLDVPEVPELPEDYSFALPMRPGNLDPRRIEEDAAVVSDAARTQPVAIVNLARALNGERIHSAVHDVCLSGEAADSGTLAIGQRGSDSEMHNVVLGELTASDAADVTTWEFVAPDKEYSRLVVASTKWPDSYTFAVEKRPEWAQRHAFGFAQDLAQQLRVAEEQ